MQGFNLLGGWKGNKFIIENLLQECYIHYLKRKKHFNFYHSAPARMKPCNTHEEEAESRKPKEKATIIHIEYPPSYAESINLHI